MGGVLTLICKLDMTSFKRARRSQALTKDISALQRAYSRQPITRFRGYDRLHQLQRTISNGDEVNHGTGWCVVNMSKCITSRMKDLFYTDSLIPKAMQVDHESVNPTHSPDTFRRTPYHSSY